MNPWEPAAPDVAQRAARPIFTEFGAEARHPPSPRKQQKGEHPMKIAITATGPQLSAELDPRFGRAAYFILVDPDAMTFEVVENTQNLDLPQGAGIQAGKTIAEHQVDVLITGNCGPKAFKVLERAGVKIVVGASGTVADAVAQFKRNQLTPVDSPNVEGHWV
jgi:predicted Fe-Mo cluster-binding NifX family protein